MNHEEMLNKLKAPFSSDRIEWRVGSCGEKQDGSIWVRCLAYIDNRAAMERLDEVFGPTWSHTEEFKQIGDRAVCTVTITIEPPVKEGDPVRLFSRTVSGSCEVEANGDIDPFKSAASGAMKRAVVNLGIGRYLYDLPEAWGVVDPKGRYDGKTKNGTRFRWNPPSLDDISSGSYAAPAQEAKEEPKTVAFRNDYKPSDPVVVKNSGGNESWRDFVIPFGKQKGQTLGSLPPNSLKWWRENYQPKPYNGKISAKDKAFRDALDASAGAYAPLPGLEKAKQEEQIEDEPTIDEVPF